MLMRMFSSPACSPAVETQHSIDRAFAKRTGPNVSGPLLFLSFDGVLHPFRNGTFSKLEILESLLREFPQVSLVISSNWRESGDLDVLLNFFSDDVAKRVVGVTPHLPHASKQEEIEAFLNTLPRAVPWLAIDDDAALFKPGDPHLIVTRTETGLDNRALEELRNRFQSF